MKTRFTLVWMRAWMLIWMLGCATQALASDPFVSAISGCLEGINTPPPDSDRADRARYRIELHQGWTVGLFAVASKDGGGLGSDLCGELGEAAGTFAEGRYAWPTALGAQRAVNLALITPAWVTMIARKARAKNADATASVQSISITALSEGHLVRVQLLATEATAERITIDLDTTGKVLVANSKVPDQFPRWLQADAIKPIAEISAPPTVDPRQALNLLLANSKAGSTAIVLRLTLSNFGAGLVYRNGRSIRQTQFNFIDGAASGMLDEAYDFPATLKACAMTLGQVEKAVYVVAEEKRFQAVAARLQHLLLECSDAKPTPRFTLYALEPFEYFDLPPGF